MTNAVKTVAADTLFKPLMDRVNNRQRHLRVKCSVKDSNLGYFSSQNLLDRFNAFQVGRIVSRAEYKRAIAASSGVTSVLDRF